MIAIENHSYFETTKTATFIQKVKTSGFLIHILKKYHVKQSENKVHSARYYKISFGIANNDVNINDKTTAPIDIRA